MSTKWTDVVSTIATIAIPIILYIATDKHQELAQKQLIENRTFNLLRELERNIHKEINNVSPNVKAECAEGNCYHFNIDVSMSKTRILNEFEGICMGANNDLLSDDVLELFALNLIKEAWSKHHKHITTIRSKGNHSIWTGCETWLKKVESKA